MPDRIQQHESRVAHSEYATILQLHETMNTFGLWDPAGAVRDAGCVRLPHAALPRSQAPNPSWTRTGFRIFLGAFAGIVVVWFWSPGAQKGTDQAMSTLSAFTVAFSSASASTSSSRRWTGSSPR